MPPPVQTSEGVNKKCFSNQEKRVCILIPLVQMNREVNIKKYNFFKNTPKKAFSVLTSEGVIKKYLSEG